MSAYLVALSVSVAKLAALVWAAWRGTQALAQLLDPGHLARRFGMGWLPLIAALALLWAQVRLLALGSIMAPLRLWTEPAWHVDLATLYSRHLAPQAFLPQALATLRLLKEQAGHYPMIVAGIPIVCTLLSSAGCAAAWRSVEAWRGLILHAWLCMLLWAALYHFLIFACWTIHWLNFWIFFVLLLFVQMWRKEGGGKYAHG